MNNQIQTARQKLIDGEYTCVLLVNGEEYCSRERGVKPLLSLLQTGNSFVGAIAADKTVGAGAAHLYVLLGIHALWANIISESAIQILKKHNVQILYGECVPHIINRQGNGICPIESAVTDAKSSQEAYDLIVAALERLQKNKDAEAATKIFKALADENRLEIMEILIDGEKCGCELLKALKIGQPTLSHHMHILCDAGLVDSFKKGKWTHYSISAEGSAQLMRLVEKYKK